MHTKCLLAGSLTTICVAAGAAQAAFDPSMLSSPDPATFANQIAAPIDVSTPSRFFSFPFAAPFATSGYINEFGSTVLDRTQLVSRVYRVNTPTVIGGLSLSPGDNVYSYTLRLVEASNNTISGLEEFQVGKLDFVGGPTFDITTVLGQGFVSSTTANTPLGGNSLALSAVGLFGGSLDFAWSTPTAQNLRNNETITLLMFTSPSTPIEGTAVFKAAPGQPSNVDPNSTGALVYIPSPLPAPGTLALAGVATLMAGRRRRRSSLRGQ